MLFSMYTVKGLEEIVVKELTTKCLDVKILEKNVKSLVVEFSGPFSSLTQVHSLDDIGIYIQPLDVKNLEIDSAKLANAIKAISEFREISNKYTVTLSVIGKKLDKHLVNNLLNHELNNLGFTYDENARTNLDLRIFSNKKDNHLSLRLFKEPACKRSYVKEKYLGSLKPSIAGAMTFIATESLPSTAKVVDNFCGSGTILKEAQDLGFDISGGDIETKAVRIATKLLGKKMFVQDAAKTSFKNDFFDCAISNLPWDQQHQTTSITDLYSKTLKEYKRILKPTFVLCLLCHKPELLIKHIKKEFGACNITQYNIGYLGQSPTIVLARMR